MKEIIYSVNKERLQQLSFIFEVLTSNKTKFFIDTFGYNFPQLTMTDENGEGVQVKVNHLIYGIGDNLEFDNIIFCDDVGEFFGNIEDDSNFKDINWHLDNLENDSGFKIHEFDIKINRDVFNTTNFIEMYCRFEDFDSLEKAMEFYEQIAKRKVDFFNSKHNSIFTIENFFIKTGA